MDQRTREWNKKVLDRIASDSDFREQLLDHPRRTLEKAGFISADDDVTGYSMSNLLFTIILPREPIELEPLPVGDPKPNPDIDPVTYPPVKKEPPLPPAD